jgi:glycosyltransferase involved in cell wall biosynthesis
VIVQACGHLARRGVAFQMFFAGDGDLLEEMKQLAASLGVSRRVHWLGHIPEPRRLLQASDIFLLSSVGEAFGLVLAEAMACGTPVIGSRSGSLPEVVEDGRSGLLVPPLDAALLADAIVRLAADSALRRGMSSAAAERARTHFAVERSVRETLQIYDRLGICSGLASYTQ